MSRSIASSCALRQVGREPELAGGEHVGRRRDDGGARVERALRGLDLDARRPPQLIRVTGVDSRTGRSAASLRDERAEALAAEGLHVALGGAREVDGRDFRQVLAGGDTARA